MESTILSPTNDFQNKNSKAENTDFTKNNPCIAYSGAMYRLNEINRILLVPLH